MLQRHLSAAGPPPAPAGPGTPAGLAARAGEALRGLDQARAQLDRALAQARAGRTFSAQELLALQADTYRFQQAVDVAARVAEAGAQSVRQAVNTQL